ncbi:MAG: hypothetical protein ACWA41_02870 [Putridiphycobacter sp.]
MSFVEFKHTVFTICNELNLTVTHFYPAGITPNFHVAHINNGALDLFVLCSQDNYWAYSSFYSQMECRLEFIDFPEFSELLFKYYDIKVLTKEELDCPFSNRYNLLEYDINYWKPQKEGDGLFNWWD